MDKNIVRSALIGLEMSPTDFARLVGVTPRAVSLWLNNQREIPGPTRAYVRLILSLPPHLRRQEIEEALEKGNSIMPPFKYRFLLWQLIAAQDSGDFDQIEIETVKRVAHDGEVSLYLRSLLSDQYDLSIYDKKDWDIIDQTWRSIANTVDTRRKFGVERHGMSLLMAYALESLQMAEMAFEAA